MTCKFCMRSGAIEILDSCRLCLAYINGLGTSGYVALARQLINLANLRRCRLAGG